MGKQLDDVRQDTRGNQVLKVMSEERSNDHVSWDDKMTRNYFTDVDDKIIKRAYEIRKYNIKDMDSLHIAYAESFNIDYFITTDKLLINASKRAGLKMKVINPIEFVMEVI